MIYLRKFDNHAAYEAAESSLVLPNVSLCEQENEVHYNPYVDPYAGHEYVDLGLPSGTKWAKYNVGANSETDYGNYYGYGKGAKIHQETSGETYYTGAENPLAASADTATQSWGGMWHMPTLTQFIELNRNTTHEWTTINGISGAKFTAQNGKYVFFPAAGNFIGSNFFDAGNTCYFWSSTPNGSSEAYYIIYRDGDYDERSGERSDLGEDAIGHSIRPVVG